MDGEAEDMLTPPPAFGEIEELEVPIIINDEEGTVEEGTDEEDTVAPATPPAHAEIQGIFFVVGSYNDAILLKSRLFVEVSFAQVNGSINWIFFDAGYEVRGGGGWEVFCEIHLPMS